MSILPHASRYWLPSVAALLIASSQALGQDAQPSASCDLQVTAFVAFDRELRAALTGEDKVAMALLVKFPLRINSDRGSYSLNDPAALQSRFSEVFSPKVRASVRIHQKNSATGGLFGEKLKVR